MCFVSVTDCCGFVSAGVTDCYVCLFVCVRRERDHFDVLRVCMYVNISVIAHVFLSLPDPTLVYVFVLFPTYHSAVYFFLPDTIVHRELDGRCW